MRKSAVQTEMARARDSVARTAGESGPDGLCVGGRDCVPKETTVSSLPCGTALPLPAVRIGAVVLNETSVWSNTLLLRLLIDTSVWSASAGANGTKKSRAARLARNSKQRSNDANKQTNKQRSVLGANGLQRREVSGWTATDPLQCSV